MTIFIKYKGRHLPMELLRDITWDDPYNVYPRLKPIEGDAFVDNKSKKIVVKLGSPGRNSFTYLIEKDDENP